jgi:replicative DNA helicase
LNNELYLLKLLYKYSNYAKYRESIDTIFIKTNNKIVFKILETIDAFYEEYKNKDIDSNESFKAYYASLYPFSSSKETESVSLVLDRLDSIVVDEELADKCITSHLQSCRSSELALLSLEVAEGKKSYEELLEFTSKLASPDVERSYTECNIVSDDLSELLTAASSEGGIYWPLRCLNRSLGPLRQGDFGFVFARPETGKTTFLSHAVSAFATQLDRPCLWFNNEEQGAKVKLRVFQSFFGVELSDLHARTDVLSSEYKAKMGGRVLIYDSASISKRDVERLCKDVNPGLIIFDQIDKIKGFQNDRHDLELKQAYQWARELSKQYGPVIAVCQAGGSGENKKWLTMDDVDSSKTGKQGEADWILGIGMTHQEGMESIRHFNISKNKLIGDEGTDPKLRHAKMDVVIRPEIARYEDVGGFK